MEITWNAIKCKVWSKLDRGKQRGYDKSRKRNHLSHFDIIRIIKALENSGILNGGVSETVKCQIKKQEGGFLGMLLGTLSVSVLANMLTEKVFLELEKML